MNRKHFLYCKKKYCCQLPLEVEILGAFSFNRLLILLLAPKSLHSNLVFLKWLGYSDLNREPSVSRLYQFPDSVDYIITLSIICLGVGRYPCITLKERSVPGSLYTFLPRLIGLARDCHIFRLRFPRIHPIFDSHS